MSPVAKRPPAQLEAAAARLLRSPPAPARKPAPGAALLREPAYVFIFSYAIYAAWGLWATLRLNIVLVDAQSRLENAFAIWWNDPPKLAAIGFYWPPLQTLALAPLTLLRPLATSLAALPLTSAFFGALLLVTVDRALTASGVSRATRWLLVAGLGLNPLVFFYATNGMAEIVALFFIALAFSFFLRWERAPTWYGLALVGFALALGVLVRYEIGLWLPIVVAGAIAVLVRRRASVPQLEASVIALVVPVVYAVVVWAFIDLTINGRLFGFIRSSVPVGSDVGAVAGVGGLTVVVREVLSMHLLLFLPVLPLAVVLVGYGAARRNPIAFVLGSSLLVNVLSTIYLVARAQQGFLLELRYNMRAIPIAVLALGWLLAALSPRVRPLAAAVAVGAVAAAIPVTGWQMRTHEHAIGERAFVRAVLTGESQDGIPTPEGTGVSVRSQRATVRFIQRTVPGRNRILTDDAQTYGIQVLDGHPERYVDRADEGDDAWLGARDNPLGRVDYFLVNRAEFRPDLIVQRYPGIRTGNPPAFLREVYTNGDYVLLRVSPPRPESTPDRRSSSSRHSTTTAPSSPRIHSSRSARPSIASRNRVASSSFP